MNYKKNSGWYYIDGNNKSPSWSGVEFLYNFIINNKSIGPFGFECSKTEIDVGDIAQLSFDGIKFSHTLVITKKDDIKDLNDIYTASHTYDSFNRNISSYDFKKIRFIKIISARKL